MKQHLNILLYRAVPCYMVNLIYFISNVIVVGLEMSMPDCPTVAPNQRPSPKASRFISHSNPLIVREIHESP